MFPGSPQQSLLKKVLPLFLLGIASPAFAQTLVDIDFETSTDLSTNFRFVLSRGEDTAQTSNPGAENDYMTVTANGGHVAPLATFIYDTTPADAVVQNTFNGLLGPVIIEGDIDTAIQANQSFGIYIVDPTQENAANHLLALFNWDSSGSNDRFRIFSGGNVSTGAPGTSAFDTTASSGLNVAGSFGHYSLSYRADIVDSTRAVLNLTVGSFSTGDVTLAPGTFLSDFEIGLRFSAINSGGVVSLDNFEVTQVPEPHSWVLIALGAVPLLWRRVRPCTGV